MRPFFQLVAALCTLVAAASFGEASLSVNTSLQYDSAASRFDNSLSTEAAFGGSFFPNANLSFFGDIAGGLKYVTTAGSFQAVASANGLASYRSGLWYAGVSLEALQYYMRGAESDDATLELGARFPLRYGGINASVYLEPRVDISHVRSLDFSGAEISPNGSLGATFLFAEAIVLDAALSGVYTRAAEDAYDTGWDAQLTFTWYPAIPVVVTGLIGGGRVDSSRTEIFSDSGVTGNIGNLTYEVSAPMWLQVYDHATDGNALAFTGTLRAAARAGLSENLDLNSNIAIQTEFAQQTYATTVSCKVGVTYRF